MKRSEPDDVRQAPAGKAVGLAASVRGSAVSLEAALSVYLPALILALGAGVALPAIPTLARTFNVGFGLASGVVTAFLIGNLAGALPSGWLIDRFGRRPVMFAGPLLTSAIAFLVAFAHTFPEFLALRFLDGCAAQMWLMGRLALISSDAAADQRGRLVSWMFGMNNVGKLAGPVLGGFIAAAWGARAPFVAYGGLALLALAPMFVFATPEPPRARGAGLARVQPRAPSARAIIAPRAAYFAVALFAGLTRGPVQADLLHLYAAFAYSLGPKAIGYLATSAAIVVLPIGFTAGWMMDRFGRKRTMAPGFIGVALAMAALAVSAFAHLSLAWYVVLFLAAIALQGLTGGSIQTIGADVAPAEARGKFLGLWRFAGQLGAALSPILFATLSQELNYGSSFLYVAGAAAIVAFLLVRYIPETRAS